MTIDYSELKAEFEREILPVVIEAYGVDDETARDEAWNNWTDAECKNGRMSELEYNFCPSFDDAGNHTGSDDARALILESLGFNLSSEYRSERNDSIEWKDNTASHYLCTLKRGAHSMEFWYSMGSGHTSEPDLPGVLFSLLSDCEGLQDDETADAESLSDFADWCNYWGFDGADWHDRVAMFRACCENAEGLAEVIHGIDREQLRALFEDY